MEARKCVGNRERVQTYAIEFGGKKTKNDEKNHAKKRENARKSAKKRENTRLFSSSFDEKNHAKKREKVRKCNSVFICTPTLYFQIGWNTHV